MKQTEYQSLTPAEKLQRSRIQLLMHQPFFGQLAMYLRFVELESVKTAATDGRHYFYNNDFINSLSEKELNFLTAHEVLHAALGHLWRRGNRHRFIFNVAADYVINAMIKDVDPRGEIFQMPSHALFDTKYHDMYAEEVYDLLIKNVTFKKVLIRVLEHGEVPPDSLAPLDNHDIWDQIIDIKDADEDTLPADQSVWNERLIKAANLAELQSKGKIPGSIRRMLQSLLEPQKNWKQLLAEFCELELNDYGFAPPDKRLVHSDIYLPDWSDQEEQLLNIVFAVDTSGSIDDNECKIFLSEVVGCMQQFAGRVKGKLIYCDSKIYHNSVYDLEDVLDSIPVGGGGTDFRPVFQWIEDHLEGECKGVVYLTDGHGTFPISEPPYPVLWVLTSEYLYNKEVGVPFGQKTLLE